MIGRSLISIPRRDVLVLVGCVTLSLVLLFLPTHSRILVADRLGVVLTTPYWRVRNFGQDVLRTRDENARITAQLVEMEMQADAADRMLRDADRMAGPALDVGYSGDLVPCRVVMRQRSRFATMVKIESLSPVQWYPWQPVISRSGYLGRLRAVINDREAWVELLSAPDFALGVEIERTGLLGVLRPRGDRFEVEMVGRDEDVRAGDRIITSGIAEFREGADHPSLLVPTPRGFPVGTVTEASSPSEAIFKEIVVTPAASFVANETVFVVVNLAAGAEGGVR